MLSSLGARRDRSRSPSEAGPPSKVFIVHETEPEHQRPSDTRLPTPGPEICRGSHHSDGNFGPKIVVQEHREEKMTSPPMLYTYAQAVTGQRSSPEGRTPVSQETAAHKPHETQHQDQEPQQQFLQQDPSRQPATETEQQHVLREQSVGEKQEFMHEEQEPQQREVYQCQAEQLAGKTPHQKPPSKKTSLSSHDLQSRKAQAMKNRPWLQKAASGDKKRPGPHPEQDPAQTEHIRSQVKAASAPQVVSHHSSTGEEQPEPQAGLAEEPQQWQGRQQNEAQQQNEQQQQQRQLQDSKKQQVVKQAKPGLDSKTKAWTVTETQSKNQTKIQDQSQPIVQPVVQVSLTDVSHSSIVSPQTTTSFSQTGLNESQSQRQTPPKPHGSVKTQSMSQTSVSAESQQLLQPQGPAHGPTDTQVHTWTPIGPSPVPALVPGHLQPPVPSHIQLRTHPQSWAPVRPPSPKPPTHKQPETIGQAKSFISTHPQSRDPLESCPDVKTHPEIHTMSMNLPQIHAKSRAQVPPQTHVQSLTQVQVHPQQKATLQTNKLSFPQVQTPAQPVARPSDPQLLTHHQTCAQPVVHHQGHPVPDSVTPSHPPILQHGFHSQGQLQAWAPVRASSPMSSQQPQAPPGTATQPQIYHPDYSHFSSQQWTNKQESQSQAIFHQRHPVTQLYPQAPMSQSYQGAQAVPQWPQQQGPQVSPQRFAHMGLSYTQPQIHLQAHTQSWSQIQPQITPQGPVQLRPHQPLQTIQTEQGHVQQQSWVQPTPPLQSQSYHHPQTKQHLMGQHQAPIQTYMVPQSHTPHQAQFQLPIQGPLQTLQTHSQTHVQTQPGLQAKPHTKPSTEPKPFQHLHPMTEKKGTSSPVSKPLDQAGFQIPTQPKVPSTVPSKAKSEPNPQPMLPKPVPSTATTMVESSTKLRIQKQTVSQPSGQSEPEVTQSMVTTKPLVLTPTQVQNEPLVLTPTQAQNEPLVLTPTQVQNESLVLTPIQVQNKPLVLTPAQAQNKTLVLAPTQVKNESLVLTPTKSQVEPRQEFKLQTETPTEPVAQSLIQPNVDLTSQSKVQSVIQSKTEAQFQAQDQLSSLPKPQTPPQSKVQGKIPTKPVVQSPIQPKYDALPQPKVQSVSQPKPEAQPQTPPESKSQSPLQTRLQTQPLPPSNSQTQSPLQTKPQQKQTSPVFQVPVLPQIRVETSEDLIRPPALAQAPPQAYTEAYIKARALAMNGFEEAKHCLQAHILEAISVFEDKCLSAEQAAVKQVNVTSPGDLMSYCDQ